MRHLIVLVLVFVGFTSCHKSKRRVSISQTRERTLFDERFSADIKDYPPLSWRAIPTTRFRLKNYLAGPTEEVQIFFGLTQGEVLQNANRWLGQFSAPVASDLSFFGTVPLLGAQAYLVEAEGKFGGGMGQESKENYALLGVIRPQEDGVITIKMVGPQADVAALREDFLEYARTLERHDPQTTPENNKFSLKDDE